MDNKRISMMVTIKDIKIMLNRRLEVAESKLKPNIAVIEELKYILIAINNI